MAVQQPAPAPVPAPAATSTTEKAPYNFRGAAIIGLIVGVIDILIVARFLGKLFGASTTSSFANFIYSVSAPLVTPFQGIFGDTGSKVNYFETSDLVAIVVYAVIGWGLVLLLKIITAPGGTKPASS